MKKVIFISAFLFVLTSCRKPPVVVEVIKEVEKVEMVTLGILSQTNKNQEYEDFFLVIDGKTYSWKIDEPERKVMRKIELTKGQHEYELTVKSKINTKEGNKMIVGSSKGILTLLDSKNMKLVWDRKMDDNVYKVSLQKVELN
jgi:hypothetical protein